MSVEDRLLAHLASAAKAIETSDRSGIAEAQSMLLGMLDLDLKRPGLEKLMSMAQSMVGKLSAKWRSVT